MKKNDTRLRLFLNAIAIIIVSCLIAGAMFLVRDRLLDNTHMLGMSLAESHALKEESKIEMYEKLIELGIYYIDSQFDEQSLDEHLLMFLEEFNYNVSMALKENVIEPYVIRDNRVIALKPDYAALGDGFLNREWYIKATNNQGHIIYSSLYKDIVTGKEVITIALKSNVSGIMFIFDLFPEELYADESMDFLTEDASYFLCNQDGEILVQNTSNPELVVPYKDDLKNVLKLIKDGAFDNKNLYKDQNGVQRGVYYYILDNGWVSIISIPTQDIFMGDSNMFFAIILISFIILGIAIEYMTIKNFFSEIRQEESDSIKNALANSYYAIHRIDLKNKTYETIKSSEDIFDNLGKHGSYNKYLEVFSKFVSEDTFDDFKKNFSIENLQMIVDHNITNFGGDLLRNFNGTYKWVNITVLFSLTSTKDHVYLCFREVHIQKKKQLEHLEFVKNSLDLARKSANEKNAFFNNMSHDMRTPLNGIIGLSNLAHQHVNDGKIDEYLDKIEASGKQLLALVNDILEISKLEQGRTLLNYNQVNIKEWFDEYINLYVEEAKVKNKRFIYEINVEHPYVLADMDKIAQILNNLISNAFKYSHNNSIIRLIVKDEMINKHSRFIFIVEDNGIGMSEEFVKILFEPYARETRFESNKISGTGLGMPIVKNLVSQMSGTIEVTSKLKIGTRFKIVLPLQVIDNEKTPDIESSEVKEISLNNYNVLLAEDNEINMDIACELLEMNGAHVVQAFNGEECYEKYLNSPDGYFDFILMDMQMPIMNGLEATKKIRNAKRVDSKKIIIIACTANAFKEDVDKVLDAGMDAHVAKPIDFKKLKEVIATLVQNN